jgi:thymidylate kinase
MLTFMLIEVEGPSGAGKTSLIQALSTTLAGSHTVIDVAAREHKLGGHAWQLGEFMRHLIPPLDHPEALFVYCARAAARARLIADLDSERVLLLCDRLRLSLHVQAGLAGLDWPDAEALARLTFKEVAVKHTVLLDIDHQSHYDRLTADGRNPAGVTAFDDVRQHFHTAYRRVDATKTKIYTASISLREVEASILSILEISGAIS